MVNVSWVMDLDHGQAIPPQLPVDGGPVIGVAPLYKKIQEYIRVASLYKKYKIIHQSDFPLQQKIHGQYVRQHARLSTFLLKIWL